MSKFRGRHPVSPHLRRNLENQVTSLRDSCSNFYKSYSENLKASTDTDLAEAIRRTPVKLINGVTTGNGLLVLLFSIAMIVAASYIGGMGTRKDFTFVAGEWGTFVWRLNNQTGRVSICLPARDDRPGECAVLLEHWYVELTAEPSEPTAGPTIAPAAAGTNSH
jgi:hypothetical protein